MISQTEVNAKTDGELLEIWANQSDYVAEMVTWVKGEIERRKLDTRGIYVFTVEEKEEAAEASSSRAIVNLATFGQLGLGLLLVFTAGFSSSEQVEARMISLAAGALLIVYAVGVWRGNRWALTSGVIVYTLITAVNMLFTVLAGLAIFGSGKDAQTWLYFLWAVASTGASTGLALMFNALRKRGRMQELGKRGVVSS
jgi:hypothetical protein